MRRKASGGVSTPEKSTPRRSTRGRVRRSPSKSPEPEPDTDEYAATTSAQDEEKNSSSEEETTSRKGVGRGRSVRGRSTPSRRKKEETPPARTRRNSRRDKESQEKTIVAEQVEENGAEMQTEQTVQREEQKEKEQPQEVVDSGASEEVMEPIPEETPEELHETDATTAEQNVAPDEQDTGSETATASARVDDRAQKERSERSPPARQDSEPESKAPAAASVEKVSHTNGDEEEEEEEEVKEANRDTERQKTVEPEDARDDSKPVVNNRSRTRQESDSNESAPEEVQRAEEDEERPTKRGEREVQPEEPSGGAEESMDAATSDTEEEAKDASSRRDSHDAVESNRKQRNDSETARDRRSPAKAKHDSPPSKEDANEEELEAGEIKDTDQQGTAEQQQQQQQCPKEEGAALEAPKIRPLQRKRRWLSSKSADAKPAVITISTDSLKNIISDVKPVPLADVKLDSSSEPEGADDAPSADENEKDRVKRKVREVNEPVTQHQPQQQPQQLAPLPQRRRPSAEKENIATDEAADGETNNGDGAGMKQKPVGEKIALTRKISIVSDDGSTVSTKAPVVRPPSPAKHLTSNILYITNLVRPFTVLQLKGLLARTGKIVENGFWIDKIKSKCYVKYETEDEATETRHALHGIRWPVSNPKCLVVDFGSEEAMDKAILSTLEDGALRATVEGAKDGKEFGWSRDAVKKEETVRRVREWDLGKKDAFDPERDVRGGRDAAGLADKDKLGADRAGRERGREIEEEHRDGRGNRLDGPPGDRSLDRGKRSAEREFGRERRRSTSVSPARKFKKKENEPPIRLLDDLFRKTKTTPCIYWLPLTTEQIAIKEEQRRKNMAEHLRRVEEQRKQEEERDRERKRERERRDRERERERERDRERERYREPDRDRDRRRSRSRERSRDDGGRRRHR